MKTELSNSLSWQLLTSILSIYFIITLLVTLVQMGTEYLHTRQAIADELKVVEKTFAPALTSALWELNSEQLEAIHQGIVDLPIITSMRVINAQGEILVDNPINDQPKGGLDHSFRITHQFAGDSIFLAEVRFKSTGEVIFERLKVGFQMIIVSALIKSAVLTFLFLIVFRHRLGLPLRNLSNAVAEIDLNTLARIPRLNFNTNKPNELTELQHVFNQMLDRLEEERIQHYAKLEQINASLEEQILERTQALQQANQRLEMLVRTDSLTGLANRRHFVEQALVEIHRSRRDGSPLALLMLDLDNFKQINDQFGHAIGDEVLKNFASINQAPLRATDIFARLGGEEFAILLPNTSLDGAIEVANRILITIREQGITHTHGTLNYSVSIGIASLTPLETDYEPMLKRADAALYRAKALGRDQFALERFSE
jgi:diguanylate cyclase (GGDEF)-like protein